MGIQNSLCCYCLFFWYFIFNIIIFSYCKSYWFIWPYWFCFYFFMYRIMIFRTLKLNVKTLVILLNTNSKFKTDSIWIVIWLWDCSSRITLYYNYFFCIDLWEKYTFLKSSFLVENNDAVNLILHYCVKKQTQGGAIM